MHLAQRVNPEQADLIHFDSGASIRDEMARAVPRYDGVQYLKRKGDAIQWGGSMLCQGARFPTADGRAHFIPLTPPDIAIPEGCFMLSTRRGKQFNSMIQGHRDPLTGARREDVLISAEDAEALDLAEGAPFLRG